MKTFYQNLCIAILLCTGFFASAQTPVLSSYPAANAVILLDFDGHTVEGTSWNSGGPLVCNGSNFNAAQVTDIFNRIAEDYRPFTINITTDPAVYLSAPATKRMRVILTTSSSWYGSAGGVAYINSFTWGDNTPCFVFTALLNHNTKNVAEAASHEIGHTLGLRHQSSYDPVCNKTTEYNAGKGSGEIGWAPIMGVGYYRNMTLWNYGANPYGCNSYQDDLSIITRAINGISFRTDDHATDAAQATPVTFTNNEFAIRGIIEMPGDIDAIRLIIPVDSRFTLDATPYAIAAGNTGSNIDLEIELLNSNETVIGLYNPSSTLNASIDTQLNAGIYYLRVNGKGNIYAPNYASLGSYSLSGSIAPSIALPLHKLQLNATTENKQHKFDWQIIADEKVVSQILEVATNGVNFQPVSTVNAATRIFHYSPTVNTLLYYRLNVVFDNGRQHYSNTVALRNNGSNGKPYMTGNIITGNITVSSPSAYTYSIHDVTGRTLNKGTITPGINTIATGSISSGLYIIQYYNGNEHYTEKFKKQ